MDEEIIVIPPSEPEGPETGVDDEVDELVQEVTELKEAARGNAQTLERIEACLQRLEALSESTSQRQTAESPMLVEIKAELAETRRELALVKESLDTTLRSREPNPLPEPEAPPILVDEEPNQDAPMDVVLDGVIEEENQPVPPPKKRRWV